MSRSSLTSDRALALISGTLKGERKATQGLLRALTPVIQSRVRALLRTISTRILQEDLVQEVWFSLLADNGRVLRNFDGKHNFESYIGVIARRAAKDVLRRSAAQKRGGLNLGESLLPETVCLSSKGDEVEARDLMRKLVAHLESLFSERGQLVMRCLYADERSVRETAELLGMTRNAVFVWQSKGRQAARRWLADVAAV